MALEAEAIVSSDQIQDLVSSRINEGAIYEYIDIQAGTLVSIGVKCRTLLFYEDEWGRVASMRLQGLSPTRHLFGEV